MQRSRRDRSLRKQDSRKRGEWHPLRSLTGFEPLEPRRLLATYEVPADSTRIDSSVHLGRDSLIKQGPGTLVLSAANLHTGGTIVEQGTLVVRNLQALGAGGVEVRAGAKLVLDGGTAAFEIAWLALDPGGRIDVGTSKLSIRTGLSREVLLTAIDAAKGDGSWNGTTGIGSSVVRAMAAEGTGRTLGWLGWVDHGDASFTVGFAAPGDTNLDGRVDMTDIGNILQQMEGNSSEPVTWNAGDFNHDNAVDIVDLVDLFSANLLDAGSYLPAPPPAMPVNLRATPVSTTSIMLSWSTIDTPAGYEVERSADGVGDWRPLTPETIQITGTSATIGGFEPGERAFLRLRAFAESPSWWWDDRYRSADTAAVAATAIPSAPGSVSARGVTPTQAEVNWTPGPGRSTGTVIQRRAAGDTAWVTAGTAATGRSFFHDAGVEPGQTYSYRVQSVSDAAASAPAMSAGSVTMPTSEPSSDADHDGDGVPDVVEFVIGSNTDAADTDGDGVGDYAEVQQGSNPTGSGSVPPDPVVLANSPAWAAELSRDDGEHRSTQVVILPSEITLPAPILVQWYGGPIALGGMSVGSGDVGDRGNEVVSIVTRWIIVDLYRADVPFEKANGGVSLTYLSIDIDIDSDNTGRVERSAWEEALEEEQYGLGKLIMLANSPFRPVTELVIDVPRPIMTVYGLPANEAGEVGLRFDWNPAGKAGSIMLWNTMVHPAARNPAPLDQGGNRIEPGKYYPLYMFRDDMMVFVEGVDENVGLKTLAGVEGEGKPEEYIRATFIVKGQDVGSDQVKYLVANEDSFFYALQKNQAVRNAVASRGVYEFADMPDFCLQPKSPRALGLGDSEKVPLSPDVPGFKAMVYQDYITGEDQYVLAFGGTDDDVWELEFNDWRNNIKQGLGWSAPQYTAAMKIGDAVGDAVGQTRLIVTGHSLGGGLASAAALVAGVRADTFNAAGLHEYTLYERDQNDEPLPNPMGGYIELYPGTAARYTVAGHLINAHYVDHEILNFVQGFIGRTAIGVQDEMDGPRDFDLALSKVSFAASVANRNPWGAAAAGLQFFGTMVELHSFPSILYGLLVMENTLGTGFQIDMLGYNEYF